MAREILVETAPPDIYTRGEGRKPLSEVEPTVYRIFEGQTFNIYFSFKDLPKIAGQVVKMGYRAHEWPNPESVKDSVTILEIEFDSESQRNSNGMNGFIMPFDFWFDTIGTNNFFKFDGFREPVRGISFSDAAVAHNFLIQRDADKKLRQAGLQINADQAIRLIQAF